MPCTGSIPDWVEPPDEEFHAAVGQALAGDDWVVEGNYRSARAVYWARVEMLVWLDLPLWLTTCRALWRSLRRVGSSDLLWGTQRESFRHSVLSPESPWIWNLRVHRRRRRQFTSLSAELEQRGGQAVRLRSQHEVDEWLERLASRSPSQRQG